MTNAEKPRLGPVVTALEIRPPERIAVGRGTAFVIAGYAYSPKRTTKCLAVRFGDSVQPAQRFGLPGLPYPAFAGGAKGHFGPSPIWAR